MNGSHFAITIGVFGAAFVAICYYFDQFRHKDPYFRKKLQHKREQEKLLKIQRLHSASNVQVNSRRSDAGSGREFKILREIEMGEKLMSDDDVERAMMHFANAIADCVDPSTLITSLKTTLPADAFELMISLLKAVYPKQYSTFKDNELISRVL